MKKKYIGLIALVAVFIVAGTLMSRSGSIVPTSPCTAAQYGAVDCNSYNSAYQVVCSASGTWYSQACPADKPTCNDATKKCEGAATPSGGSGTSSSCPSSKCVSGYVFSSPVIGAGAGAYHLTGTGFDCYYLDKPPTACARGCNADSTACAPANQNCPASACQANIWGEGIFYATLSSTGSYTITVGGGPCTYSSAQGCGSGFVCGPAGTCISSSAPTSCPTTCAYGCNPGTFTCAQPPACPTSCSLGCVSGTTTCAAAPAASASEPCGNGRCAGAESPQTCPQDCPASTCPSTCAYGCNPGTVNCAAASTSGAGAATGGATTVECTSDTACQDKLNDCGATCLSGKCNYGRAVAPQSCPDGTQNLYQKYPVCAWQTCEQTAQQTQQAAAQPQTTQVFDLNAFTMANFGLSSTMFIVVLLIVIVIIAVAAFVLLKG